MEWTEEKVADLLSACYWGCKVKSLNMKALSAAIGILSRTALAENLQKAGILKGNGQAKPWTWLPQRPPDEQMIKEVYLHLTRAHTRIKNSTQATQYVLPYQFADLKNQVLEQTGLLREVLTALQELRVTLHQEAFAKT